MDKVLEKWTDYGFLEGLADEDKPKLANHYEVMANFLISQPDNSKYRKLETLVFPVLRRVYESTNYKDVEPTELLDDVLEIMDSPAYNIMYSQLKCFNAIDCEAEMINYIIETYIEDNV